jgi:hypothetical protein
MQVRMAAAEYAWRRGSQYRTHRSLGHESRDVANKGGGLRSKDVPLAPLAIVISTLEPFYLVDGSLYFRSLSTAWGTPNPNRSSSIVATRPPVASRATARFRRNLTRPSTSAS